MSDVAAGGQKKGSALGTFFWIVGFLCLAFWIAILLDEIQTTEAAMHLDLGHSLLPNWLVLWQPVALVTGTLDSNAVAPVLVGWIVELFVLIFTFAYEIGAVFMKKYNTKLSKAFTTVCFLALGWDGYTNWNSNFANDSIQSHIVFTVALAVGAVLLPIGALACFKLAQMEG